MSTTPVPTIAAVITENALKWSMIGTASTLGLFIFILLIALYGKIKINHAGGDGYQRVESNNNGQGVGKIL
jgi:hypothetical protein